MPTPMPARAEELIEEDVETGARSVVEVEEAVATGEGVTITVTAIVVVIVVDAEVVGAMSLAVLDWRRGSGDEGASAGTAATEVEVAPKARAALEKGSRIGTEDVVAASGMSRELIGMVGGAIELSLSTAAAAGGGAEDTAAAAVAAVATGVAAAASEVKVSTAVLAPDASCG